MTLSANDKDKILILAVKEAVRVGLLPKTASTEEQHLKDWGKIQAVLMVVFREVEAKE